MTNMGQKFFFFNYVLNMKNYKMPISTQSIQETTKPLMLWQILGNGWVSRTFQHLTSSIRVFIITFKKLKIECAEFQKFKFLQKGSMHLNVKNCPNCSSNEFTRIYLVTNSISYLQGLQRKS